MGIIQQLFSTKFITCNCRMNLMTVFIACIIANGVSQYNFPGCSELKSTDFKYTEIFTKKGPGVKYIALMEGIAMDLNPIYEGDKLAYMDVYFIERAGKVNYYDDKAKTIKQIGKIAVHGNHDNALMGMILHPDFKQNRWVYFWYSPPLTPGRDNRMLRLTRINLDENHNLIMSSEKILWEVLGSDTDEWHSGGPMTFDKDGDLWITFGNNSKDHDKNNFSHLSKTDSTRSEEWGTSNTASMRGSIMRIHPDSSEKGYSVPEGNFGDYWADVFEKEGKSSLAEEYRNRKKVLPEIYTKGHRSNFSVSVHPKKKWLTWKITNTTL